MSLAELDVFLSGLIYLAAVFVLFIIGKFLFDLLHPGFKLKHELFENDNFALSLAFVGYYLGLVLSLGGVLTGEGSDLEGNLIDIGLFGLLALVLLNISSVINEKIVLRKFNHAKELIGDRNAGTGAVLAGHYIANGLIVSGAVAGDEGHVFISLAFWGLGQLALIVFAEIYNVVTPYDIHTEIEKDNVAVGVAVGGLLIAIGNLVRLAITGSFESWARDLTQFGTYLAMGIVLLPLIRLATDKILLPGVRLTHELVEQEEPNVGAGAIEAFSYVAGSMLIGWAIF